MSLSVVNSCRTVRVSLVDSPLTKDAGIVCWLTSVNILKKCMLLCVE